jgi:hypothetical protein
VCVVYCSMLCDPGALFTTLWALKRVLKRGRSSCRNNGLWVSGCLFLSVCDCLSVCLPTYLHACMHARPYACLPASVCTTIRDCVILPLG